MQNEISRRAFAANLVLAPAVALPVIAGARSQETDPILAACADLKKLTFDRKRAAEKLDAAIELYESLLPEKTHVSMPGGMAYHNLEDFDESYLGEIYHRTEPTRKLRAQLVEIEAARKSAAKQSGLAQAMEASSDAYERICDLETEILMMVPSSPAGATALLRVARAVIDDDRKDGFEANVAAIAALDRVANFFERREAV
jgi:hypothetical protein